METTVPVTVHVTFRTELPGVGFIDRTEEVTPAQADALERIVHQQRKREMEAQERQNRREIEQLVKYGLL